MKKVAFFGLAIIYIPIMIIMHFLHDKEGGWYVGLWQSPNPFKKVLFLIVSIVLVPLMYFMRFAFEFWEKLAE